MVSIIPLSSSPSLSLTSSLSLLLSFLPPYLSLFSPATKNPDHDRSGLHHHPSSALRFKTSGLKPCAAPTSTSDEAQNPDANVDNLGSEPRLPALVVDDEAPSSTFAGGRTLPSANNICPPFLGCCSPTITPSSSAVDLVPSSRQSRHRLRRRSVTPATLALFFFVFLESLQPELPETIEREKRPGERRGAEQRESKSQTSREKKERKQREKRREKRKERREEKER